MRTTTLLAMVALALLSSPAMAQLVPGSVGNGGRMPETMLPGAMPPPATMPAPSSPSPPPSASYGNRYPNTESLSRDRIESQGYRVQRITPQSNGSWKAETRRDGVPSRVIIYPDGRQVEER
jgi:hypothetical protein